MLAMAALAAPPAPCAASSRCLALPARRNSALLQGTLGELVRNPVLSYRQQQSKAQFRCNSLLRTQEQELKQQQQQQQLTVEECVQKMQQSLGADDLGEHEQVNITGRQCFMGMEGDWAFSWCSNGCFYEQFRNEEITVDGGYDAEEKPWQADYAGRVTRLDLDDHENILLAAWLRTGCWITAAGLPKVDISLGPESTNPSSELVLSVHLKDSKIVAVVHVSRDTWMVTRMTAKVFGGNDSWEYSNWRAVLPGRKLKFPCTIKRFPPAGGVDTFHVDRVELDKPSPSLFAVSTSDLIPRHNKRCTTVEFDEKISPTIEMLHTLSGHYVVKPLVDGKDIGYFVVDTGASGLSIAPHLAESLDMESFGEIYVTGVESQKKSRFLRGSSFQVGRLKIVNPVYIEVGMEGVVRGVQPVVGICGFDLFYHSIVEMSMKDKTLSLFSHTDYELPNLQSWQELRMLENVPHISAKFNGHESLFLLDTGAGGVDIIFPKKTVETYGLLKNPNKFLSAKVKGVNAVSGIQALYGELDNFEVGGHSFDQVKALFFQGEGGLIDFSVYCSGILCEQLLRPFLLVMDYKQCRICLVR